MLMLISFWLSKLLSWLAELVRSEFSNSFEENNCPAFPLSFLTSKLKLGPDIKFLSSIIWGTNGKFTWYNCGLANCSTTQHWLLISYYEGSGSYNLINTVASPAFEVSKTKLLAIKTLFCPKFK